MEKTKAWTELQDAAFEAIKIAEIEKSGIRSGDGYWNTVSVIKHTFERLSKAIRELDEQCRINEPISEFLLNDSDKNLL